MKREDPVAVLGQTRVQKKGLEERFPELEPKEGQLNIETGFEMWVYSNSKWERVSLWRRLHWLLTGRMS